MFYLWLLFSLLLVLTYLPAVFSLGLIVGVGLSSILLIVSAPLWLRALRGRGGGGVGLWLVLGVFVLFMAVRFVEVLVFWDHLLYMVEKAWGLILA